MHLRHIVWKEVRERPGAMLSSVLAILLGVTALVAIRHVNVFSEAQVKQQLETLGANVLILPKGATLQDYYAADLHGQTLPEEHVSAVLLAGLMGVEKLSPKLCVPASLGDRTVTLTGILPQSEFQAKAAWQTVGLLSPKKAHAGCKKAHLWSDTSTQPPETLSTARTIDRLGVDEVVIGADIASQTGLRPGESVKLLGKKFTVIAQLPPSGTVDDSRIFGHLHTIQDLARAGQVVSAIEVLGCCEDAAGQLVPQLSELLPDAKVVTISQIVNTQVGINRVMAKSSLFVLGTLVLVGGLSVASATSSNVRERRREIGTLLAVGAAPGFIARLFLVKAVWLGLAGGVGGAVIGMLAAVWLGPAWAGVAVSPLPGLALLAVGVAVAISVTAAYWPARHAARLDPCACFQEF